MWPPSPGFSDRRTRSRPPATSATSPKARFVGRSHFYGIQRGPTSSGRTWLLDVTNVSVTPYTYTEDFTGNETVLSRDNLKIAFRVHTVWRVDDSEDPAVHGALQHDRWPARHRKRTRRDRESRLRQLRPRAAEDVRARRGAAPQRPGDQGRADSDWRRRSGPHPAYAADTPFIITSVVVGNVQYPSEVSDAVSRKLAATQELQRKDTEIEIERKERTKREVQAQGIANAMEIIRGQLSPMYVQHEAIEAQKAMVNSPNHTVVYIPVGPMGVPLTGTFSTTTGK